MGLPIRSNAMKNRRKRLLATFAACGIAVMFGAPARAADTSPWVADSYSAVRLIAGANKTNAESLRAGIEIKIQPGWHTYWRYSGDSGVPPRFSFSGSDNLAAVKVLYPAPRALSDEAGTTIGYKGNVILPLRVIPRQKDKPVTLRVKIEYAVCEKLCVPVEANTELTIHSAGVESDALLAAAEAQVPKPITATEAGLSARRANDDKRKPLVLVDLATPTGEPTQIFVEGPSAEWALPIPKPTQGAPAGYQQFRFELDGLPPGVDPKRPFELTFTIVRGDRAIEVKTHLD
jgi:DsbC/DsbD-like thiol-disulfide interchange protein